METGFLNFHDEEHFSVFCGDNVDLVNDSSLFDLDNSLVELDHVDASWAFTTPGVEFEGQAATTETKEDYQKTIQEWQKHISSLGVNENCSKDDSALLPGLPEIFSTPVPEPQKAPEPEPPKEEEVLSYKVAKRKGLVLKLTKKKEKDCDKSRVNKKEHSSGKSKKKNSSFIVNTPTVIKPDHFEVPTIKIEPDYSKEIEEAVANIEFLQPRNNFSSVKEEPIDFDFDSFNYEQPFCEPVQVPEIQLSVPIVVKNEEAIFEKTDKSEEATNPKEEINKFDLPNIVENIIAPKLKVENEDYFSIKQEAAEYESNIWLSIKEEPATSPYANFESPKPVADVSDEQIDIEKVDVGPTPIVEAGSVASLLSQFESSNTTKAVKVKTEKTSDASSFKNTFPKPLEAKPKQQKPTQIVPPLKPTQVVAPLKVTNKSIIEALPTEVINKIKETSKRTRRSVPLVPAEPLPVKGNEHMKDAGATPAKTQRVAVSTTIKPRENAKLDHAYCSSSQQAEKNNAEKTNRSNPSPEWEKKWEKKDSGLESGDVSDSSETLERAKEKQNNSLNELQIKEEPQVTSPEPGEIIEEEPKKKKLNLEEYRNRRKNIKTKSPPKAKLSSPTKPSKHVEKPVVKSSQMVNAEVQVKIDESKTAKDVVSERRKSPFAGRIRRSSSSSESSVDKSRYRRRGRSRRSRSSRSRKYRSRARSHSRSRSRSYSRSRSRSKSRHASVSSSSSCSSSSRSRSRSRGRSRSSRRKRSRSYRRSSSQRYSSRTYSPRLGYKRSEDWSPVEKMRQVEERRVVYVGRLEEGTTRAQLRERFSMFGPIVDISLHFREKGDNYGFVTFAYRDDAYDAVEHGNDHHLQPKYDICFGGRRAFCKQRYSDLDGTSPQPYSPHQQNSRSSDSFDKLLREAQKKLKRSGHV